MSGPGVFGVRTFMEHVHLITRYRGDTEDPKRKVRWIFPEKAKYWKI